MTKFISIADVRVDEGSPVDEDLLTDLRDNMKHNHDNAWRGGTHASGIRHAFARGKQEFSGTTDAGGVIQFTVAIDWTAGGADDAEDGDPNFSTTPSFIYSVHESQTGGPAGADWAGFTNSAAVLYNHNILAGSVGVGGATVMIEIDGNAGMGSTLIEGFVHWVATAHVTGSE